MTMRIVLAARRGPFHGCRSWWMVTAAAKRLGPVPCVAN